MSIKRNHLISRRQFIKGSGVLLATSSLAAAGAGCSAIVYTPQQEVLEPPTYSLEEGGRVVVQLGRVPALNEAGGAAAIVDKTLENNLIIARTAEDRFTVAANYCSHRQMALGYDHAKQRFYCSSLGGSEYDLDGKVLAGAAKEPLKLYQAELQGRNLVISLS